MTRYECLKILASLIKDEDLVVTARRDHQVLVFDQ